MEFQTLGQNKTFSSTAEIPILNNFIPEPAESFICVIVRSRRVDGIVVEEPNTITIVIEDDDCEYSSVHGRQCSSYLYGLDYLSMIIYV